MVTPAVWVRLMPKFPPVVTLTFLTVTLLALTCRLPEMDRPLSTVPSPVTTTVLVVAFQVQPGPLVTWAGTCFKVVPAGTPVVAAVG